MTARAVARRYVHALRAARARQLRARLLRPLNRRRSGPALRRTRFVPLAAEAFWRSPAFVEADEVAAPIESGALELLGERVAYPPRDWAAPELDRLRRFHLHYGHEVLGCARGGKGELARRALASWIEGNPPRSGDAWHPYVVSTRVPRWIAALSLAPDLASPAVVESLRVQLAYLRANVEHDILGNHVLRNACALALGGLAFADEGLCADGAALLARELPEQVLPDGGHYERSPAYHAVVLRDLLELRAVAAWTWLDEPIDRMRRFAAALARPDGAPALFNDGAVDLAPRLDLPGPPPGLAVFRATGYAVVRERDLWLAFDCGPPAPAFLPPHAHADALSFQLWQRERAVVVDPGTFTYEPGAEREWFRGTRSHATVSVDGGDQFELWGAFRAGPLPDVRLLSADEGALVGEVVWRGGVRHVRRLSWSAGRVDVDDEVTGRGVHLVESRLPLAPGQRATTVRTADGRVPEVEDGWLSERFFERSRIPVAVQRVRAPLPVRLGWTIGLRA